MANFRRSTISITVSELRKHLDHKDDICIDSGRGDKPGLEVFSIWCKVCNDYVGNEIQVEELFNKTTPAG